MQENYRLLTNVYWFLFIKFRLFENYNLKVLIKTKLLGWNSYLCTIKIFGFKLRFINQIHSHILWKKFCRFNKYWAKIIRDYL